MIKKRNSLFAFSNINNNGAVQVRKGSSTYHKAKIDPVYGLSILCKCTNVQKFPVTDNVVFFNNAIGNCKN